jgi:redox-sensitive bicupin YhaK (pirin superfamily)
VESLQGPVTGIAASPLYLDVQLSAGASYNQPVSVGHTVLAYIYAGGGIIGETEVTAVNMVVFGAGSQIEVRAGVSKLHFMLMAGLPFMEPIVPYGPFVMNTRKEIQQALDDLKNGSFVYEGAKGLG